MILFSLVEGRNRNQFGHDRSFPNLGDVQLGNELFRCVFLLRRMPEDDRAILRTHISPLSIAGGWIVGTEKDFEYFTVGNLRWIELNLHYFRMPRLSGTDGHVTRV